MLVLPEVPFTPDPILQPTVIRTTPIDEDEVQLSMGTYSRRTGPQLLYSSCISLGSAKSQSEVVTYSTEALETNQECTE